MKAGIAHLKKLFQFSKQIEKLPQADSEQNLEERLRIAQNQWYAGVGKSKLDYISRFTTSEIDASTGSSAFAPDDDIAKEVSNLDPSLLPEYHNHLPQKDLVSAAQRYFQQIGVIDNKTKILQDFQGTAKKDDYFSMVGDGTTQLFSSSLKSIFKTEGDVIIFTSPTYGLFLPAISEANGKIEILHLNVRNNFKPSVKEITQLISETNQKLREEYLEQTSAVYKLLPIKKGKVANNSSDDRLLNALRIVSNLAKNNVSFKVLDAATTSFNDLLQDSFDMNMQKRLRLPLCPRVRSYFHINPHMPTGTICDQNEINQLASALKNFPDVIVFDDLSYFDLVLADAKTKPGTFANSVLKDRTITLYSLSKQFALASTRAGIALGPKYLIEPIGESIFKTTNSPGILTFNALYSILRWEQEKRETYLQEITDEYTFRRDFTIALIEGSSKIAKTYLEKIKQTLTQLKIDSSEQAILLKGIPRLKILLKPYSGFFLLIDFSAFKGKYLGTTQLNDSKDFHAAFQFLADINTIPSELMYDFNHTVLRYTYSMEPKEILEGLLRIKILLDLCSTTPLSKEKAINANKNTMVPLNTKKPSTFLVQFPKHKQNNSAKEKAALTKDTLRRSQRKITRTKF